MRNRTSLAFLVIAGTLLAVPAAQAVLLYSVDTTNDQLVRLDSVTGAVTDIGALGQNAFDIDLALTSDGRLWGLNAQSGTRVDLWEIDKITGAILSSSQVLESGNPVTSAEGLGALGGQLRIGYSPAGNSNSNTLGNLSTTGEVSVAITTAVDMDGLANGHSNPFGLYATDRAPGTNTFLYGVNPLTGTSALVGLYADTLGFHDLVTLSGEAIVIDTFADVLYRIDLGTGAFLGGRNDNTNRS